MIGQNKTIDTDVVLKNAFYKKYRREVLSYSHKDYDALFFDYIAKINDKTNVLTKEQYYTYTIKISIYSEKLGLLYKDKKDIATVTKQQWFDKKYADYLKSIK